MTYNVFSGTLNPTHFLHGLTQVLNPNGISIGSAVFAGSLAHSYDRSTNYSVGNKASYTYVVQRCDLIIQNNIKQHVGLTVRTLNTIV